MTISFRSLAMALAFVLAMGFLVEAKACRDCPFPMKVGENKWMMPNGYLRIDIEERALPKKYSQVHIMLYDVRTGQIIAEGMSRGPSSRKVLNIQLIDASGQPVQGYIRYMDEAREHIQAKFTCESCAISDAID